ncbi:helix-turn-helix transcriptional regulator [Cellulomonas triticagri]|uniref:helix-turn-helix transcriptional regulator n=1 Tax=Cellulomonas triticagri TaxID=2483352 RepID=UPI001315A78F|nr:helix-turn-helix domain-containing protein [Cellulomonas triticagri]
MVGTRAVPDAGPGALAGFDGTTGRGDHGGRRTHVIQLLRDSPTPLPVAAVAERLGVALSSARAHLEALADAGLAVRTRDTGGAPGRPRVLYRGVLPNQAHERAQGFRLLAESLVSTLLASAPESALHLDAVGRGWGRAVAACAGPTTGDDPVDRLVAKLDALWFAPERLPDGDDGTVRLVLHHCPLLHVSARDPQAVAALERGLVDGVLEAAGSSLRVTSATSGPVGRRSTVHLAAPGPAGQLRASAPGRA